MTEQNFGEKVYTSDSAEDNRQVTNSMLDDSDHFADQAPVETDRLVEAPMGGTVAAVSPLIEPMGNEAAAYEPVSVLNRSDDAFVEEPAVDEFMEEPAMERTLPYPAVPFGTPKTPEGSDDMSTGALLNRDDSERFRGRWNEIQGKFVDEPRTAVQQADVLVSEVIGQITDMFANEHSALEGQWNQGNDVSTEDLRKSLQRYRSFFNRLVLPGRTESER